MSGKQAKKTRRIVSYAADGAGSLTRNVAPRGHAPAEQDASAALTVVKFFSFVVMAGMVLVMAGRMSADQLIELVRELLKLFVPAFGLFWGGAAAARYLPRRRGRRGLRE